MLIQLPYCYGYQTKIVINSSLHILIIYRQLNWLQAKLNFCHCQLLISLIPCRISQPDRIKHDSDHHFRKKNMHRLNHKFKIGWIGEFFCMLHLCDVKIKLCTKERPRVCSVQVQGNQNLAYSCSADNS